jgi:hypothetical protein
MTKRTFDDGFWGDPFVQDLDKDSRLLFAYLWTNKRCNAAGLYEITPKTICFETGLMASDLPRLFEKLNSKVKWIPADNLVWVKNFLKHQAHSPQFLSAVAEALTKVSHSKVVQEFIDYNVSIGILIPYQDGNDTHPIPSYTDNISISDKDSNTNKGDYKGEKKKGKQKEKNPTEVVKLMRQVWAGLSARRKGYNPGNGAAESSAIIGMIKQGKTPDEILSTWDAMKKQPFWQDKELFMMSVRKQIGGVLNGTTQNNSRAVRKPDEYTDPNTLRTYEISNTS